MVNLPGVPVSFWPVLAAAAGDARLALVGGAVRDLLLHHQHRDPWRGLVDLDLVIEAAQGLGAQDDSPAMGLAKRLADSSGELRLCCVRPHGRYGTVELEVELELECLGAQEERPAAALPRLLLDVASARREHYPIPGDNPMVRLGCLEDDLARRDFTVNAMAVDLATGTLLDPHGGQHDLAARSLRFLHPHSLRDDPSRLVRAARYAARLGFGLAPESLLQATSTLLQWPWAWRPGDPPGAAPPALGTRLRMELDLLLEREKWREALAHLQAWGGLALLDAGLQADRYWRLRLARASQYGLPLLAALLAGAADPLGLAERLQVPHRQHRLLVQLGELRRRLAVAGWDASGRAVAPSVLWPPSRWSALLEQPGLSPEAVALALACGDHPRRPMLRWWHRWRHLQAPVSAAELIAQGIPRGPQLGALLRQARFEWLDRECP